MGVKAKTDASAFFWRTAAALMSRPDVSEGTLMEFPCLRVGGGFFATCDHRSGDLIVKLPRRNLSTTMGHSTGLIREQCPVW